MLFLLYLILYPLSFVVLTLYIQKGYMTKNGKCYRFRAGPVVFEAYGRMFRLGSAGGSVRPEGIVAEKRSLGCNIVVCRVS